MEKTVYYRTFALEAPEIATGVFRHRDLGPGMGAYLERFDVPTRTWINDYAALTGYLFNGEPGAETIAPDDAERTILRL